jgi:D-alanyl-D-alanine endopeptidase (penicillin-binding protein 7)
VAAVLLALGLGTAWFWPSLSPQVDRLLGRNVTEATATAAATATATGTAAPAQAPADGPAVPATAEVAAASQPAAPAVVEAPSGEDTQVEPTQPVQSVARMQGLHRKPDPLKLHSSAALVVDAATGRELAGKNPDAVLPVASLTKLMTGLLVAESKVPMDEVITITEDDVDHQRNSRSRLRVGTELTRAEALHLALMSSENRAAHALGRTHPGGLEAFVGAMNARARALGMTQTRYVDPTGLSMRNQSTPRDIALLVRAASREPLLRDYSTTPRHEVQFGKRTLVYNNSNRLVKKPDWDIQLQKTGYIVEAGQCVTMRFRVDGRDLVVVLLDANDKRSRSADAERIRRWAMGDAEGGERQAATPERQRSPDGKRGGSQAT